MKITKLIIFLTFAAMFLGCEANRDYKGAASSSSWKEYSFPNVNQGDSQVPLLIQEFEYEGCQYLISKVSYSSVISHKGNCKNPIHKCK